MRTFKIILGITLLVGVVVAAKINKYNADERIRLQTYERCPGSVTLNGVQSCEWCGDTISIVLPRETISYNRNQVHEYSEQPGDKLSVFLYSVMSPQGEQLKVIEVTRPRQ